MKPAPRQRESSLGNRQLLADASYGSTLQHVTFAGAALTSVSLPDLLWIDRCSFVGADMRQATLDGAHFKFCDLRDADLRGASLRGVTFCGCDLRGADLRAVDLRYATFGRVNTGDDSGRNLLTGARLDPGALDLAQVEPEAIIDATVRR